MPKSGGMFYATEFVLASGEYEVAGTTTDDKSLNKHETNSFTWNNGFHYSFTDDMQIGLGLNYQFSGKDKHKSGVGSDGTTAVTTANLEAETNDKSLKNIELNARYRVMEEAPVTMDVLAGLSLGIREDKKSESYTVSGVNKARNGNAAEATQILLGTELGKKHGDVQWKGALGFNYGLKHDVTSLDKGDTNASSVSVDTKYEQDSFFDFNLALAGEYHLTSAFAMGAKGKVDFIGEKTLTKKPAVSSNYATTITQKSYTDITLGLEGKYEFTNSILARIGFDYVMGGEYEYVTKTSATSSSTMKYKERNDMRFALGMDFSF